MVEMIPIVAIISTFTMIVMVVWLGTKSKQKQIDALTAVQTRMLDKFGDAKEFVDFMQSAEGREFLRGTSATRVRGSCDRVEKSLRTGIILSLLGIAFLVLSRFEDGDMIVPGVLILAVGVGFLLSAGVSWKFRSIRNDQDDHPQLTA
jgi:hypothetical protein